MIGFAPNWLTRSWQLQILTMEEEKRRGEEERRDTHHLHRRRIMGSSSVLILFFSVFLLHLPFACNAILHKPNRFRPELLQKLSSNYAINVTRDFEVTKPVEVPPTKPCSYLILQHDFGYTYGEPPVLANYTPPSNCPSQNFSKIVFEWKATCQGVQYDRILGVWLSGVELFRSCTAEPTEAGIVWTVRKDITRYSSLLKSNQTLAVYLGNIVDSTYTGVYHVNITFHFYPEVVPPNPLELSGYGVSPADLVLPISRNLPLDDGLWFEIENATEVVTKEFKIPQNAYRAVLEVYLSFHQNDEFWYTNPTNDYIMANNLTGEVAGNGPYREVVVSLDGSVVGAAWPFTVVYTGGINPLLWRPITGIGSFNLPSYDIEITPFLGNLLDGLNHTFGFSVTHALDVWYVDANLHLWLDSKRNRTLGKLIKYKSPPTQISVDQHYIGLNGYAITTASRSIISLGWVKSSYGNITTYSVQDFNYKNSMEIKDNFNVQIVTQTIEANNRVFAKLPSFIYSSELMQKFLIYLYYEDVILGPESYSAVTNLSLGFNEDTFSVATSGFFTSSSRNLQTGQGNLLIVGDYVVSGLGSTQEVYAYDSNEDCYFRNVSSAGGIVLYDEIRFNCDRTSSRGFAFKLS